MAGAASSLVGQDRVREGEVARRLCQQAVVRANRGVVVDLGLQRLVVGLLHDLLLQAQKGARTLAVQHGHVDAEQANEAVGHVLGPRRLAIGGPRHAPRQAGRLERPRPRQEGLVGTRDGGQRPAQRHLAATGSAHTRRRSGSRRWRPDTTRTWN